LEINSNLFAYSHIFRKPIFSVAIVIWLLKSMNKCYGRPYLFINDVAQVYSELTLVLVVAQCSLAFLIIWHATVFYAGLVLLPTNLIRSISWHLVWSIIVILFQKINVNTWVHVQTPPYCIVLYCIVLYCIVLWLCRCWCCMFINHIFCNVIFRSIRLVNAVHILHYI